MKYVVILGDGMADEPIESLGGRTILEAANTPYMDELSKVSEIVPIPSSFPSLTISLPPSLPISRISVRLIPIRPLRSPSSWPS